MYETYWGVSESPFANTFEERWFVDSSTHEEALARILFVLDSGQPCAALTGPSGTGKSLLLNMVFHEAMPPGRRTLLVDLAGLGAESLLWELNCQLDRSPSTGLSVNALWRNLADELRGLRAAGQPVVILADHVDRGLSEAVVVLERLLSISSSAQGSMTMILGGEAVPGQRIREMSSMRIELGALEVTETVHFINRRLKNAGCHRESIFDESAMTALHQQSGGIPRRINQLCELSLLAAMGEDQTTVNSEVVRRVAQELTLLGDAA